MPPDNTDENRWYASHLAPHEPMLRAWLGSRFPEGLDVDDVVQEACLRVLKARERSQLKAPKAFLFATARNLALNTLRSAAVRGARSSVNIDDCDFLDESADTHESVARGQELEILTLAIQSLPDRCRQIFTLRKVYGMTQREIARKLGLSPRTVNAQISIGVNKCSEFVETYCGGERR